jgi:hypothetical protein
VADSQNPSFSAESQPSHFSVLFESTTKSAFAGLRVLFLLAALVCMIVQLLTMLKIPEPTSFVWTDYLFVMVAVILFVMFLIIGRKGGRIRLFPNHVEGKRSMGVPFSFTIEEIVDIQLQPKRLAIRGKEGILLMETPKEATIGGAIWLRKQYQDWEVAIWQAVKFQQPDSFDRATRFFLGTDNAANFGDRGFLVPTSDALWFFPESAMFPVKGQSGEPTRPYMRSTEAAATMIQIEPSPETLPLAEFCAALVRAAIEPKVLEAHWEELAEIHGGCRCFPSDPEGQFLGECMGYQVVVVPNEQ